MSWRSLYSWLWDKTYSSKYMVLNKSGIAIERVCKSVYGMDDVSMNRAWFGREPPTTKQNTGARFFFYFLCLCLFRWNVESATRVYKQNKSNNNNDNLYIIVQRMYKCVIIIYISLQPKARKKNHPNTSSSKCLSIFNTFVQIDDFYTYIFRLKL